MKSDVIEDIVVDFSLGENDQRYTCSNLFQPAPQAGCKYQTDSLLIKHIVKK